jgi:hypothetical protein
MGSPGTAPVKESEIQPQESEIQPPPLVTHDLELAKWQRTLLPVMTLFVIALALAFFVLSTKTLTGVGEFVQAEHGELREQIKAVINTKQADTPEEVIRRGLLLLEADALDRRYHQASALLMSRIWAKNLAFMTGMIMAFLGAIFILGKLSESPTAVKGGASGWNVSITSASPGILLAFFGTTLVALSIVIHDNIDVHDGTAYLTSVSVQNEAASPAANSSGGAVDHSITDKIKALKQQSSPTSVKGR